MAVAVLLMQNMALGYCGCLDTVVIGECVNLDDCCGTCGEQSTDNKRPCGSIVEILLDDFDKSRQPVSELVEVIDDPNLVTIAANCCAFCVESKGLVVLLAPLERPPPPRGFLHRVYCVALI